MKINPIVNLLLPLGLRSWAQSLFGGSCFLWLYNKMNNKRTTIYIGFNLYYGCLKKSPYKWLDLKLLFENLLDSSHQINKIKYYTAHISSRNDNEASRIRQRYYLNALEKYIPEI